ncbi:MAG: hypothetical protein ACKPKO_58845, partial [Candidatus Fonsibacter sp.]
MNDTVKVKGGCLKGGRQVDIRRNDGHLIVLVENSEFLSQEAEGTLRSRSGIWRTSCLKKLRRISITRLQGTALPASALAEDPMQEMKVHPCQNDDERPPSKR